MGKSELIATLRREAEEEAAAILERAHARASEILASAEREVEERRRRSLGEREAKLRAAAMRDVAEEERLARTRVLAARERVINRILERAVALLETPAVGAEYESFVAAHVEEALSFLGDGEATIRCPPAIATPVTGAVGRRPGVRVESDPEAAMGVVVEDRAARVRIDNTLRGRLERLRPLLRSALSRRLGEN